MPSPRQIQQAIDAAALQARAQAIELREKQAAEAARLLERFAADLRLEILSLTDGGRELRVQDIPTLRAWLDGRMGDFMRRYGHLLDDSTLRAAELGTSVLSVTSPDTPAASMVRGVLDYLQSFRAADGLQLSDRLWRLRQLATTELHGAIEGAIVRGQSSMQAAQAYVARAASVPADLAAGIAGARPGAVASAARRLLANPAGDVLYAAQRVIRTETNRAYTESYVASVALHPDVVGVRFNLSPLHPKADICDMYARANLYGLGPGVYPPGNHPYPAHPNTISYLTTVFADQVSDADRAGRTTPFAWLEHADAATQEAVLGGKRKAAAFRAGQLQDDDLRRPWYEIAPRLGVDA